MRTIEEIQKLEDSLKENSCVYLLHALAGVKNERWFNELDSLEDPELADAVVYVLTLLRERKYGERGWGTTAGQAALHTVGVTGAVQSSLNFDASPAPAAQQPYCVYVEVRVFNRMVENLFQAAQVSWLPGSAKPTTAQLRSLFSEN